MLYVRATSSPNHLHCYLKASNQRGQAEANIEHFQERKVQELLFREKEKEKKHMHHLAKPSFLHLAEARTAIISFCCVGLILSICECVLQLLSRSFKQLLC